MSWSFGNLSTIGLPMGQIHEPYIGPMWNAYLQNCCTQGVHASWKTGKVREYEKIIPGPGKVLELGKWSQNPGKV